LTRTPGASFTITMSTADATSCSSAACVAMNFVIAKDDMSIICNLSWPWSTPVGPAWVKGGANVVTDALFVANAACTNAAFTTLSPALTVATL